MSEPKQPENESPTETALADESRRRFTKAGAAASGVILTLASRPVLANQCTISGMMSGNTSSPHQVRCEGCTPGFWTNPVGVTRWPAPYTPGTCKQHAGNGQCKEWKKDGTKFHSMYGGPFGGNIFGDKTMMEVMLLSGTGDPYQMGAHACAALLNALTLQNYGYSASDIISMWNTYHMTQPQQMKNTFQMLNERYCPFGR